MSLTINTSPIVTTQAQYILTDSRQAAIGHARGDKLEVASVH